MRKVDDPADFAAMVGKLPPRGQGQLRHDEALLGEMDHLALAMIEVQVFGRQAHGNVASTMFERECSLQRRSQIIGDREKPPRPRA